MKMAPRIPTIPRIPRLHGWGEGGNGEGPQTGPMSRVVDDENQSSFTSPFDMAAPGAVLMIATKFTGAFTGLIVTHGGEEFLPVVTSIDPVSQMFTGIYAGFGLTIETANLVITAVGGLIGPAMYRVSDTYGDNPLITSWFGAQSGLGSKADQGVMTVTGLGNTPGPVFSVLASQMVTPVPYVGPSTQFQPLLTSFGMSGTRVAAPVFTSGIQWTETDGWWVHSGSNTSAMNAPDMGSNLAVPFGYEVEVDIPVGGSLSIQMFNADGVSYITDAIREPVQGTVRFYHEDSEFAVRRWRVLGTGNVRFKNLRYVANPNTIRGQFWQSNNNAVNNQRLWFYFGSDSRFAGVAAEIHGDASSIYLIDSYANGAYLVSESGYYLVVDDSLLGFPPLNVG